MEWICSDNDGCLQLELKNCKVHSIHIQYRVYVYVDIVLTNFLDITVSYHILDKKNLPQGERYRYIVFVDIICWHLMWDATLNRYMLQFFSLVYFLTLACLCLHLRAEQNTSEFLLFVNVVLLMHCQKAVLINLVHGLSQMFSIFSIAGITYNQPQQNTQSGEASIFNRSRMRSKTGIDQRLRQTFYIIQKFYIKRFLQIIHMINSMTSQNNNNIKVKLFIPE